MKNKIAHAKSYPFPSPDHSFLYANGRTEALTGSKFDRTGRTPVLAAGSNQSPEQIHRKYGDMTGEVVIPAQRGRLHDVEAAAHVARGQLDGGLKPLVVERDALSRRDLGEATDHGGLLDRAEAEARAAGLHGGDDLVDVVADDAEARILCGLFNHSSQSVLRVPSHVVRLVQDNQLHFLVFEQGSFRFVEEE